MDSEAPMTLTQSLLDIYEREATKNDPHSPWYDGPDDDETAENDGEDPPALSRPF